jgi:hypothetical protein
MKEKQLSIALGLTRDILKEFRESYIEGVDWKKVESRKPQHLWEVEWSDEGIAKLKDNIGFKETEKITAPEVKRAIVFNKFKNPKVMGVTIDGVFHNVLCKDSSKFHKGMPVDVRWDGNRWCVVRHPRFNGKY